MHAFVLIIVLLVVSPTFSQQPKAITNSIGMKLVLIHAGSFTMGSPIEQVGIYKDTLTQHEVTISKSYYLGVFEVTQGHYEKVMGNNPSHFKGNQLPVENVSWDDTISFCKMPSELPAEKKAMREYRLPTEAEWEYACRASSGGEYCFGDSTESLDEYAWFGKGPPGSTIPVGAKKSNRWGLYDMHGNVFEWCLDGHADYPSAEAPILSGQVTVRAACSVAAVGTMKRCVAGRRFAARPTGRPVRAASASALS